MKNRAIVLLSVILSGTLVIGEEKVMKPELEKAVLAGGCFWCLQPAFDDLPGVEKTTVGYTGGTLKNPTYEEVSGGGTGHVEAAEIVFNPAVTSFDAILDEFWRNIDPTDAGGQFYDRGEQYKTVIFYQDERQKKTAEDSLDRMEKAEVFKKKIAVDIRPASAFYPAEEYHQKYYCKRPGPYRAYKAGSGRESFLKKVWGGK